ncbi:hypothetical protein H0H87_011766 [Tephrocybe sp. NHM501043]|nr:hypothetical protein H0H87_011766 [Tephrocybe sp. NHM501043]
MLTSFNLVLLLGSSFALGASTARKCGSTPSDAQVLAAEAHFQANKVSYDNSDVLAAAPVIPVNFHVVTASNDTNPSKGYVSDGQIDKQIAVLNVAYKSTGLSFQLANTTRTVNELWFTNVGPENKYQTAMKRSLRTGGPAVLNVYTVGFKAGSGQGLLGYATFPVNYANAEQDDGVVILSSSLPGGTAKPYDLGQASVLLLKGRAWLTAVVMASATKSATPPRRMGLRMVVPSDGIRVQAEVLIPYVRAYAG